MENDSTQFYDNIDRALAKFYDESDNPSATPKKLTLAPPEQRYINPTFIAEGAIKSIYEVTDTYADRRVAMAKIKPELLDTKKSLAEDFLREAKITSSLEHPNIIRLYDIGLDPQDAPWFTMELIPGHSLQEVLSNLKQGDRHTASIWNQQKLIDVFLSICHAISYAHSLQILHLDIKPDNVRLGEHGEILLCDWGLSHFLTHNSENPLNDLKNAQTAHGFIKGTPGYMAPEQTLPSYTKDPTTDIFGLGALLYSILTYNAPFKHDSVDTTLEHTRQGKLSSSAIHHHLPQSILAVSLKALATEPKERYHSVEQLIEDVEHYRSGFATGAENASTSKLLKLFYRRNKTLCITTSSLLIILIAGTFLFLNALRKSENYAVQEKDKAIQALTALSTEQEHKRKSQIDLAKSLHKQCKVHIAKFQYDMALATVNQATFLDPDTTLYSKQKGFIHFIRQEYQQALECYSKIPDIDGSLKALSLKYANQARPLPADEITKIMSSFKKSRGPLKIHMLRYHDRLEKSHSEVAKIVNHLVQLTNKKKINFHYNENTKILDLSNNKSLNTLLYTYSLEANIVSEVKYSLLQHLTISHLDISHTNISDLNELKKLKIKSLDLRGTPIKDLAPLRKLPKLATVTLTNDQSFLTNDENWPFTIQWKK